MLDAKIRHYLNPLLNFVIKPLDKSGIAPNHLTITGGVFGLCCMVALVFNFYGSALVFLILSRLFDALDGQLAHYRDMNGHKHGVGSTHFGGYLDIVFDMLFYGGFVFAFMAGQPQFAPYAAFLLFTFMGTASSFLAYAIVSQKAEKKRNVVHDKKSFTYAAGLIEGTETIIFFALMCLLPQYFPALVLIFGALCLITTAARIRKTAEEYQEI